MLGLLRLAAIVGLFYLIYRILKDWGGKSRVPAERREGEARELVRDPQTGVFFPRDEGLAHRIDGEVLYFQSRETRDAYVRERRTKR